MYSEKILKLLKKKGIAIGDEVSVKCPDSRAYSGLLMPRPFGHSGVLVLKLDNGYNVGLSADGAEIKLLTKAESGLDRTPATGSLKQNAGPGSIAILGCGGTIASKVEYKTGAVYPAITPSELRMAFPELERLSKIHSRSLFSLFSEDMNSSHWKKLADEIEKEAKAKSQGVVVMHGTDTMGYTAAAMSFMLQNLPFPVVFVGAQRSSDRPSSENEMNMLNAVYSAKQNIGEVCLCMHASPNDDFCYLHHGTKVRKMHTSKRNAFKSVNANPLAAVDYRRDRFELLSESRKRSGPLKKNTKFNDNVALIYVHPGIKPKFISSLSKYDGVVLMGTGLGHIPTNSFNDKTVIAVLPQVKQLIASGIPVVMAPQTIYGRLNMKVYTTGRLLKEAGVIGDGTDWLPETAYVKLCWVLGHTKDRKKVEEMMLTNIAGEITERSVIR